MIMVFGSRCISVYADGLNERSLQVETGVLSEQWTYSKKVEVRAYPLLQINICEPGPCISGVATDWPQRWCHYKVITPDPELVSVEF